MGSSPSTLYTPPLVVGAEAVHSNLVTPTKKEDNDALPTYDAANTPTTTDNDETSPPTSPTTYGALGLAIVSPRVVLSEHVAPSLPTPLGIRNLPPLALRTQSTGSRFPLGELTSLQCSTDDVLNLGTGRASCSHPDFGPPSPLNCSGKRVGGVSTLAALTRRSRGMGTSISSLQSVSFMRTVSNPPAHPSGSASVYGVPSPKMYTSVISDRSPLTAHEDVHNIHYTSSQRSSTKFDEGRSPPAYHHYLPALPASLNEPHGTAYRHQHRRLSHKRSSSSDSDNSHSDVISTDGEGSDDDCFHLSSRRGTLSEDPSARSMSMGEGGACLFSHIYRPNNHRVSGVSVRTSTTPSVSNGISGSYLGESSAMHGHSNEVSITTFTHATLPHFIKARAMGDSVGVVGGAACEEIGSTPPTAK